jgi:hypothetical protein
MPDQFSMSPDKQSVETAFSLISQAQFPVTRQSVSLFGKDGPFS